MWGRLGIFKKYMREYVKFDAEYVFSTSRPKPAFVFRLFGGVGIAIKIPPCRFFKTVLRRWQQ
ncbi:MAG: hypothetical protein R2765_07960 [Ferruginibacter sp.]